MRPEEGAAEFLVREAREDDAERFVRAYESAWDATLAEIAGVRLGTVVSFEARVEGFRTGLAEASPDACIFVAERAEEIVGMATCRREGRTGELRGLYVVPDAWGTGVAVQLMEAALSAMRRRGVRDAFLWVVEANGRARRFYEREGWAADGEKRESSAGPLEVRYRLQLTS